MSSKKESVVITDEHIISTLAYIRSLIDAIVETLMTRQDIDYSQVAPGLPPIKPYGKECAPPEIKPYGRDCVLVQMKPYGRDCVLPQAKPYGKEFAPPEIKPYGKECRTAGAAERLTIRRKVVAEEKAKKAKR